MSYPFLVELFRVSRLYKNVHEPPAIDNGFYLIWRQDIGKVEMIGWQACRRRQWTKQMRIFDAHRHEAVRLLLGSLLTFK